MRALLVFVLMLVSATPVVQAGTLSGVSMEEEILVDGTTLTLNGMGLRKKLWVEVYVAGLYLEKKTSDAAEASKIDGEKRIVMHFLTDKAKKNKMDAAWDEGFEANSPAAWKGLKARVETFKSFFGDMKDGDVIQLTIRPGEGTKAELNGREVGVIEGDDFAEALLKVWLGEEPPSEDLRDGLLGK